ncbi:hypothetical protein IPM19_00350 [bacterium]|nr:MAG: hypothetical protein IPM19_00350 [bacterium]
MFGYMAGAVSIPMWWKIIIVGLAGKKPSYKLFSSEDTTETRIEPVQKANFQTAYKLAQGYARSYQQRYDLVQMPRIIVIQVPKPVVTNTDDLHKVVDNFVSGYMNTGFVELMRSFYWKKAIESNPEIDKRLALGYSVFKSMLAKDLAGWEAFRNEYSTKIDALELILKDIFESHYRWYHESHHPAVAQAN